MTKQNRRLKDEFRNDINTLLTYIKKGVVFLYEIPERKRQLKLSLVQKKAEKAQKKMMLMVSEDVKALVENMKDYPERWEVGEHLLVHVKSGARIWIANGVDYVDLYDRENSKRQGAFNKQEKLYIWNQFRIMRGDYVQESDGVRRNRMVGEAMRKIKE